MKTSHPTMNLTMLRIQISPMYVECCRKETFSALSSLVLNLSCQCPT